MRFVAPMHAPKVCVTHTHTQTRKQQQQQQYHVFKITYYKQWSSDKSKQYVRAKYKYGCPGKYLERYLSVYEL